MYLFTISWLASIVTGMYSQMAWGDPRHARLFFFRGIFFSPINFYIKLWPWKLYIFLKFRNGFFTFLQDRMKKGRPVTVLELFQYVETCATMWYLISADCPYKPLLHIFFQTKSALPPLKRHSKCHNYMAHTASMHYDKAEQMCN